MGRFFSTAKVDYQGFINTKSVQNDLKRFRKLLTDNKNHLIMYFSINTLFILTYGLLRTYFLKLFEKPFSKEVVLSIKEISEDSNSNFYTITDSRLLKRMAEANKYKVNPITHDFSDITGLSDLDRDFLLANVNYEINQFVWSIGTIVPKAQQYLIKMSSGTTNVETVSTATIDVRDIKLPACDQKFRL
jgi:hypothetical protein